MSNKAMRPEQLERLRDEGLFTGDMAAGLEVLRRKLLDLTTRNRLLAYRHSKRSSLRIVDELPDYVFAKLLDGASPSFAAIEKPSKEEREQLSVSRDSGQLISAIDVARLRSLVTEYDLPVARPGGPSVQLPQHRDNQLQTLLFPEDLNASLETLYRTARVSREERGINILFLAFGFLEWRDHDDSDEGYLAPLMLVPVTLERGGIDRSTGFRQYKLSYSGEDIGENLSLREKLNQLGPVLPAIQDDRDAEKVLEPERYFSRFTPILNTKRNWKLRRWLTLGCFEFSKLLLYRDLNPEAWPTHRKLSDHPLIKVFFEKTSSTEPGGSEVYSDLDSNDKSSRYPTILEADSSQHSVIVDALDGKNLVVQGPPGTGKSQTITNMIAAALGAGKTVLFVSEKLAALEVVRRRLEKAELGDFCLELHSHKAQKRTLLDDLKRRLRIRHLPAPTRIEARLDKYEKLRRVLAEYASFVSQPWGQIQWPIKDLIASAVEYRRRARISDEILRACSVGDPNSISESGIEETTSQLKRLVRAHQRVVSTSRTWQSHPLFGFDNHELNFMGHRALVEKKRNLSVKLELIEEELHRLRELSTAELSLPIHDLAKCVESSQPWPELPTELPRYFSKLREPGLRAQLRRFVADLVHYRESVASLDSIMDSSAVLVDTNRATIKAALSDLPILNQVDAPRPVVSRVGRDCAQVASLARECVQGRDKIYSELRIDVGKDLWGLKTLIILQKLASTTPWKQLRARTKAMLLPSFPALLAEFETITAKTIVHKSRLENDLDASAIRDKDRMAEYLLVARTVGRFRAFDSRWRRTSRELRGLSRIPRRRRPAEWVVLLEAAIAYLDGRQAIEINEAYREAFGIAFRGHETDTRGVRELLHWQSNVRDQLKDVPNGGQLADLLLTSDEEWLHSLAGAGNAYRQIFDRFSRLVEMVDRIELAAVRNRLLEEPSLERLADTADQVALGIGNLTAAWDLVSAQPTCTVAQLRESIERADAIAAFGRYLAGNHSIATALGAAFRGPETDCDALRGACDAADALVSLNLPSHIRGAAFEAKDRHAYLMIGQSLNALGAAISEFNDAANELKAIIAPNAGNWPRISFDAQTASEISDFLKQVPENSTDIDEIVDFVRRSDELRRRGLGPIIARLRTDSLTEQEIEDAYRCIVHTVIAEEIFRQNPEYAQFREIDHEGTRSQLAELDQEILELQRSLIAHRLASRPVPHGTAGGRASDFSDLALIKREIQKERRHIPIRQLVLRSWQALIGLKPCFMMSPLSVAQYLEPGEIEFDLVVMDEASQIRPEEALGAIARAKQMVVVGDSKQLPPTSFFERAHLDEEENDDATIAAESESILEASAAILPSRSLTWHYRSQHESLILFSNKYFYEDELAVFPSAHSKHPDYGVKWQFVPDGDFRGSRNQREAEAIAAAALRHMEEGRTESLGIVAMNIDQAELIENLIDAKIAKSRLAEQWITQRDRGSEPFFVKNLENVQGDERDVILVSFTYGRGASGLPEQNFGPINRGYGWRRLNVLYTRARKRVVVFSSMRHDGISDTGRNPKALIALRDYLRFAETGQIELASETGRAPESPFEQSVIRILTERGYKCVPQVGVSNYRIDVAVRHPDRPGEFLIGIECDGAPYHSGRSIRDRDRIRQSILESLGWRICRIWSADWYRDTDRQIGKIEREIERALRESREREGRRSDQITPPESPHARAGLGVRQAAAAQGQPAVRFGLSVEEARQELIQLRERVIKPQFENSDPEHGLLRRSMLEKLLQVRPASRQEFLNKVPLSLRENTDSRQVAEYLDKVLEILSEIRE